MGKGLVWLLMQESLLAWTPPTPLQTWALLYCLGTSLINFQPFLAV